MLFVGQGDVGGGGGEGVGGGNLVIVLLDGVSASINV